MEGKGTYFWPDGSKYEGDWKNGMQNGIGIHTSASGILKSGKWKEGKKVA
jgi:hypothetical protein